jgi:hypothetical protein
VALQATQELRRATLATLAQLSVGLLLPPVRCGPTGPQAAMTELPGRDERGRGRIRDVAK